jgi:polyisoprenoid-binding protein YceI
MTNVITPAQAENKTDTSISTWIADPAHTLVEFSGKHMMITTVKGSFSGVEATILLDESDITKSSVTATIDATTLYTGVEYRDNHLRSADFLDVEHNPTLEFKSKRIERKSDDEFRVIGDLTIKGLAREVVLDTTLEGRGPGMDGKERIAFTARTAINRKDWGLSWNVVLEKGALLVGETIKIELHVQAVQPVAAESVA